KTLEVKVKLGEYTEENIHKEMAIKFPMLFDFPVPPKVPMQHEPPLRPFQWEKRKYIGVFLQETTKGLAEYFGLKDGAGLLINELTKDGPAEKAGLRVGDVIFKADGKRVNNVIELSSVVQTKKKGDKVKIEYMRDKKALSVMVEVAEQETGGPLGMMDEGYFNSLVRFFEPDQKWMRGLEENFEKQMKEFERSRQEWQENYSKQMEENRKKIDKELKQGFRTIYRSWPLQRI
ncbi:MAG TPA: PDZ domain-containing protein, partial [Acidobacteriota bacterium]